MPIPSEISTWLEQSKITPIECCGKGGYGEIWLVRAPFGQNWALKIIDKKSLDSTAWSREVRAVQKYRATIGLELNLLYIQQAGDLQDYFFYLMEVADNRNPNANGPYMPDTLENRLHEQRLTFIDTRNYINGLLDGLQILHKRGLIHRDIKPANILFVNGRPKFGDLGLVTDYTPTLSFAGTEGFCPPSLLKGIQVDGMLWDLYSMGMVVYCCVTGYASPCFPEIPDDLMDNPLMRRINAFLERACSPDPHDCFKNVEEFRTAFNACFQKSQSSGKQYAFSLMLGIATGFACAAGLLPLARMQSPKNQPPPVQETTAITPIVSTIQPFKRNSTALFNDSFAQGYKKDWNVNVSNGKPLRKVGIDGLFWNIDDKMSQNNSLTLALPSLALPVNFEIAWECFGEFDDCTLVATFHPADSSVPSTYDGIQFEMSETHGNVNIRRVIQHGKTLLEQPQPAPSFGNNEDNNVFITTNRIVKDGAKLTFYLDEQAMYTLELTKQDMDFLKNARFSMTYSTNDLGIAVIKNFTIFIVPGLE